MGTLDCEEGEGNGGGGYFDVDEYDNGRREGVAHGEELVEALLALVFAGYEFDALLDCLDGLADVADGDDGGATEILAGDALDGGGHGGGVHHCLAVAVCTAEDLRHCGGVLGVFGVGFFVGDGEGVEDFVDGLFESEVNLCYGR